LASPHNRVLYAPFQAAEDGRRDLDELPAAVIDSGAAFLTAMGGVGSSEESTLAIQGLASHTSQHTRHALGSVWLATLVEITLGG